MFELDNVLESWFHTERKQILDPLMTHLPLVFSIFEHLVQELAHVEILNVGVDEFNDG